MGVSGQILVEVAPDLVGLFVPGAKILGELGKAAAEKAGWIDKLEDLASRADAGRPDLEQSQVFEQYTKVLIALAEKQPLLLVVDDLQWADDGSASLLFRLGRRLEGSRVLIVGTYRPEEVALDRHGVRHPLQKVLAELKRYFGEIEVDLDRAKETEGKQFVDALLAAEPNRLSEDFGHILLQHTRGHALFTVELLRDMQEHGALVRDDQGRWLEGPHLDWNDLPDRVEGIIEERNGRVEETLRRILLVASVEGQDFTAQVIARVEEIGERELLRLLSQELEKLHRLVREREEVRLGNRFLARYQFNHVLFQQYLYNELGEGERRLLHGQIATLLEELYRGHTGRIAVQLARHFAEAGNDDRSADYLLQAGDAAYRLHAHAEARLHYARASEALARLPDTAENGRRRIDALTKQVGSSWLAVSSDESLERLAEAERLVTGLAGPDGLSNDDQMRRALVHYWMGRIHYLGVRLPEAIRYYSLALSAAREMGDPGLMAMSSSAIGQALVVQGRNGRAEPLLRQAVAAMDRPENKVSWALALAFHGGALAGMGDYEEGRTEVERAVDCAQQLGNLTLTCTVCQVQSLVHGLGGTWLRAMEAIRKAVEAAEQSGDPLLVYSSYGWMAWSEAGSGRFEDAAASMERAQGVAKDLGGWPLFTDWFRAADARISLGAGRPLEALVLAEKAVAIAQEADNPAAEAYARETWGLALAALEAPHWDEAEAHLSECSRLYQSMPALPSAAHLHAVWGDACRDRGDRAAARERWNEAAALWEACGIAWQVERMRARIETLP